MRLKSRENYYIRETRDRFVRSVDYYDFGDEGGCIRVGIYIGDSGAADDV